MSTYITVSGEITFNSTLSYNQAIDVLVNAKRVVRDGDDYFLLNELGEHESHHPIISASEPMVISFNESYMRNAYQLIHKLTAMPDVQSQLAIYSSNSFGSIIAIVNGKELSANGVAGIRQYVKEFGEFEEDVLILDPEEFEAKYADEDCHAQNREMLLSLAASNILNEMRNNALD